MRVARCRAKGAWLNRAKCTVMGRVSRRLRRFGRDEDGSMIIFTLFLIIMMLIVGGMAVDLMRFETNRSRLAATLDRAILAAADLDQTLSPEQVVRDYFQKAGLLDQLKSVTVVETVNSRSVSARASINVNMMFMDLLGIEQLEAPAAGMARETITDIEIALVLDISGSMRSNSKIQNLRIAASNFVQTVLANDVNNKISISIVPFNAQVNLGAPLRGQYNVTDLNGIANSNCIDLPTTVFAAPGMSRTLAMPQSGYFDALTTTTLNASYYAAQAPNFPTAPSYNDSSPTCKVLANNIVRLPSNNIATLQANINGLTADGNTSITLGMKWALALLDPGSRQIYTNLIASSNISANFAGRPYEYTRQNTLKVIVVMTDGEHVASTRLNDGYRSGNSTIYRHTDGLYSIRHSAGFPVGYPFWAPHLSAWQWRAWNGTAAGAGTVTPACASNDDTATDPDGKGICVRVVSGTPLTWPQVWTQLRMSWVAQQLYARPLSNNNATNRTNIYNSLMDPTKVTAFFQRSITAAQMDTQLQASCMQARTNGVVVFSVAFEAPPLGQALLANCASSPSHYYVANGSQINDAFFAIANQIQSLRLMQ